MDLKNSLENDSVCRCISTDNLVINAERTPDKEVLVFKNKRYTFRQFNEKVNRLANSLIEMGIKKDDNAAILSHNCDQFLIYWYALMKIGAVMVPVNWLYNEDEIKYIIEHSESKLLVVEDLYINKIESMRDNLTTVKKYGVIKSSHSEIPDGWFDIEVLQNENSVPDELEIEIKDDDTALIIYTSGTESLPKGAMLSHKSFVVGIASAQWANKFRRDMVYLIGLPFFHLAGLWLFYNTAAVGGKSVVMYSVEPKEILELTKMEKVTHWSWVTTIYVNLLRLPEFDKSFIETLEIAIIFGSYVSQSLIKQWIDLNPKMLFMNAYGQTECVNITCNYEAESQFRLESVGRTNLFTRLQIHGPDGEKLPVGQEGEIVVRSPLAMKGYFKDPEKTTDVFRGGWLHTGDIGRMDEEGRLYFIDRIKDMIKTGGENVASTEVEEILIQHAKISEVAVIGLKDPVWQEAVVAVIVPMEGQEIEEAEIVEFCKTKMAGYKVPKRVIFRKELPKSNVGKILKRDLKMIYEETFG